MDEKYCLKSDYDLLRVNAIENELWKQRGIQSTYRGHASSFDGKFESNIVVDCHAFYVVCDMLSRTRQELREERNKKWWQRRKNKV